MFLVVIAAGGLQAGHPGGLTTLALSGRQLQKTFQTEERRNEENGDGRVFLVAIASSTACRELGIRVGRGGASQAATVFEQESVLHAMRVRKDAWHRSRRNAWCGATGVDVEGNQRSAERWWKRSASAEWRRMPVGAAGALRVG